MVQTSTTGAGNPAASFRVLTIVCRHTVLLIETKPIHGESLWAFYRALWRCGSPFKKLTAERWRPGTGASPESIRLAVRLGAFKGILAAIWLTSFLKIVNYLVGHVHKSEEKRVGNTRLICWYPFLILIIFTHSMPLFAFGCRFVAEDAENDSCQTIMCMRTEPISWGWTHLHFHI